MGYTVFKCTSSNRTAISSDSYIYFSAPGVMVVETENGYENVKKTVKKEKSMKLRKKVNRVICAYIITHHGCSGDLRITRSDGRRMKQDGGTEQMPQEQPGITMAGSGLMETRMQFRVLLISLRTDTS